MPSFGQPNGPVGSVTEVRIAARTGFCYGVREAVDQAKEAAGAGKRVSTLGAVVHNEGVIAALGARGIGSITDLSEAPAGSAVVIRAHGVTPAVRADAAARDLELIDGTCSWVLGEQRQLAGLVAEGYTIVLLGTPNHPEVVGLLGFAPEAIVVDDESDWECIPRHKRMALLTQSTQPPWKFERLAAFMVGRAHELKVINSVCPVTIRRQQDTVELARSVDLVVVVGGRASANTRELTRLCEIVGVPAIQIERAGDLNDPRVFGSATRVGVTGGTSTPIEDLEAVAERVLSLAGTPAAVAQAAALAAVARRAAFTPAGRTSSLSAPDSPAANGSRPPWAPLFSSPA